MACLDTSKKSAMKIEPFLTKTNQSLLHDMLGRSWQEEYYDLLGREVCRLSDDYYYVVHN